jgi:putative ABC transport system ATP-binding protein
VSDQAAIVVADAVVKTYAAEPEPVVALSDVSVRVEPRDFLAVTGPSGSGKSTLLNCLSGLDGVDSGSVRVDGVNLVSLSENARADLRASRMGFVFQSPNLLSVFSALDNVALPLMLSGQAGTAASACAEAALDRVGLGHRRDHRPQHLSGGEQQRVAIARALARNPEIVWADEPTGHLDSSSAESVLELLREVQHAGAAVVLVTHDLQVAAAADRRVEMRDGRIVHSS